MATENPEKLKAPPFCPVCDEDVPVRSLACPACGADHRSGWREDADDHDGLDLQDQDFNYDDFVRDEFGSNAPRLKTVWWIAAIILLVAFALIYWRSAHSL